MVFILTYTPVKSCTHPSQFYGGCMVAVKTMYNGNDQTGNQEKGDGEQGKGFW